MATNRTVHLPDENGGIHHWLISPAWSDLIADLDRFVAPDGDPFTVAPGDDRLPRWVLTNAPDSAPLKERLAQAHPLPATPPAGAVAEEEPFTWAVGGAFRQGRWTRYRTAHDAFVDWSAFCPTPHYRWAVAATILEVDQAEWRTIEVDCTGPFVLWADDVEILRNATVSYMEPERSSIRVRLPSGTTTLHVATAQAAFRECRHIVRVRVRGLPVRVVLPSPGADEHAARLAETILDAVAVRSWAVTGSRATLDAPPGAALRVRPISAGHVPSWERVRVPADGRFEVDLSKQQESSTGTGTAILATGETGIQVGLDDPRCPQHVELRVANLPTDCRTVADGEPAQWREEVLHHVADGRGPASVLADAALGRHVSVRPEDVADSLASIHARADCADFEVIALLLLWHRLHESRWDERAREDVRAAVTGIRYWLDQPGLDAMCFFTENHQFVWHVAQTLAGETFPADRFADGRNGSTHAQEGAARTADWLRRKVDGAFSEFDSNAYLAIDTLAMVALIEHCQNRDLASVASTLLDRTLISLAANSWRGIHGSAHGRSYVRTQRSARFEETSPILRLLAGVGTLNDAALPVTALAAAQTYQAPTTVRSLATDPGPAWWGRQVNSGRLRFERDLLRRPYRADIRLWRTPEVMLSSVQDYRSGLPGLQEHVWQATLGPETQVYLSHPANSDTTGAARPNAWMGHRILPRVHQHRDTLVGVHRGTPSDPVAGTHLWFPAAHFDRWHQRGPWLAGAVGRGYVAIAGPGGFTPSTAGDTAWQEWHLCDGRAWVCLVGDVERDGDFETFLATVEHTELRWSGDPQNPGVRVARPDRPVLQLSFDGPFTIDGVPEGLDAHGRPSQEDHLDNPAVIAPLRAEQVKVTWGGNHTELDLGRARTRAEEIARGAH